MIFAIYYVWQCSLRLQPPHRSSRITARIEPSGDYRRLHELAVADNLQRENLTPIEEAKALRDLMDEQGMSQRELASRMWRAPRCRAAART